MCSHIYWFSFIISFIASLPACPETVSFNLFFSLTDFKINYTPTLKENSNNTKQYKQKQSHLQFHHLEITIVYIFVIILCSEEITYPKRSLAFAPKLLGGDLYTPGMSCLIVVSLFAWGLCSQENLTQSDSLQGLWTTQYQFQSPEELITKGISQIFRRGWRPESGHTDRMPSSPSELP